MGDAGRFDPTHEILADFADKRLLPVIQGAEKPVLLPCHSSKVS
jgi:hypothetical protein